MAEKPDSSERSGHWQKALVSLMGAVFLSVSLAMPATAKTLNQQIGDKLQILLPVAGMVCSLGRREIVDYALRFAALEAFVHIPKNVLGDATINLRPTGGDRGFPSGHTAAAFYGASYLARTCLRESPVGQVTVFGLAMFTGGSRIEAGAHFLLQVMAGGLIGFLVDALFRRKPVQGDARPGFMQRLKSMRW